jgi:DNA-binding NarL/FixJ family response regulator
MLSELTPHELEVLIEVARGRSNAEIAAEICVT